ncbi:hypothetical protein GIG_03642 [Mycoplasmopsis anatis 1340]|uniref:Lipoprotein n=1 Tax=Mycoplasmopsis anatis 1340 TaxID=1034808 RepID=F9QEB7_9BACT|nr:hypothetical protein GIG_03642 [Mycoplasmopsis anatis 1340]VEU73893.1 Uncharacterised protein [Mycoplasmopsis anatis]
MKKSKILISVCSLTTSISLATTPYFNLNNGSEDKAK